MLLSTCSTTFSPGIPKLPFFVLGLAYIFPFLSLPARASVSASSLSPPCLCGTILSMIPVQCFSTPHIVSLRCHFLSAIFPLTTSSLLQGDGSLLSGWEAAFSISGFNTEGGEAGSGISYHVTQDGGSKVSLLFYGMRGGKTSSATSY